MPNNKETKTEAKEYPDIPDTSVDIQAIRKKYLMLYSDRYKEHADESVRGISTLQGNIYVLWQVRRFLEDLGLGEQVEEVHTAVQKKYPNWHGIFLTHEGSSHVGGGSV